MDMNTEKCLQLERYVEQYRQVLKTARICVFEVDLVRQKYLSFENAEDIFGVSGEKILKDVLPYSRLSPEEYRRAVSLYFSHPEDEDVIEEAFHSIFQGKSAAYQARMKAGDTKYTWCKIDVTPVMEGDVPVRMIGVISDINQLRAQIQKLQLRARLDGFTRLYNKTYAQKLMRKTLEENPGKNHALLIFDLDNFKKINDTYGHEEGDRVLLEVARSLPRVLDRSDVIGRFGGDEFVLLITGYPGREALEEKISGILEASDNSHGVTKSIGAALFPENGASLEELFMKADQALYQAKKKKNNCVFFQEKE